MHVHAAQLALRLGEDQRFLAQYEHGGAAEKVRRNNRAAHGNRARAFDDGDGVGIGAGIGHGSQASSWLGLSRPSTSFLAQQRRGCPARGRA